MIRKGSNNDLSKMLQDLMNSYHQMILVTEQISSITQKTNLLSLNSSIEAARVGESGKGFSVIAKEIQAMANQSKQANINSREYMYDMKSRISDVAGVRTADIAFDLIDKIERNLFERNCDVQAWATFEAIIDCLTDPNDTKLSSVAKLLNKLCKLYEVYKDIILADINGNVVSNAINTELVGINVKDTDWFRAVIEIGSNTSSDMYFSKINGYTVSYSTPVRNSKGDMIGVLSTRFNWDYIYEIIEEAKISEKGLVSVINSAGIVIASNNKDNVLKKDYSGSEVFSSLQNDEYYGYMLDEDDKGNLIGIIGYSRTKGYKTYRGKNWSVIVEEKFS